MSKARVRRIPIFCPEQLTDEMKQRWRDVGANTLPDWLECNPLRNDDGSIAIAGPVGWLEVEND